MGTMAGSALRASEVSTRYGGAMHTKRRLGAATQRVVTVSPSST